MAFGKYYCTNAAYQTNLARRRPVLQTRHGKIGYKLFGVVSAIINVVVAVSPVPNGEWFFFKFVSMMPIPKLVSQYPTFSLIHGSNAKVVAARQHKKDQK